MSVNSIAIIAHTSFHGLPRKLWCPKALTSTRRHDSCFFGPFAREIIDERCWDCGLRNGLCSARTAFLTEVSNMGLVVLIILIVLLLGGLPTWGYHSYGYGPSGIVGVLLIVLVVLLLTGRI